MAWQGVSAGAAASAFSAQVRVQALACAPAIAAPAWPVARGVPPAKGSWPGVWTCRRRCVPLAGRRPADLRKRDAERGQPRHNARREEDGPAALAGVVTGGALRRVAGLAAGAGERRCGQRPAPVRGSA